MTSGVRGDDMRDRVVDLANQGLSMRQIGHRLGISNSAAAGHCHRARGGGVHVERFRTFGPGLVNPATPTAIKKHRTRSRLAAEALPGDTVAQASTPEPARPAVLSPGTRTCRYIAGEKSVDFKLYSDPGVFCGEPVLAGSAYCPNCHRETHMRRAEDEAGQPFQERGTGAVDTAWR
jgi:hypothetical protein